MSDTNTTSIAPTPIEIPSAPISPVVFSTQPSDFRFFKSADGATVLQGAYVYSSPAGNGVEWRDIPTVSE